MGAREDGERAAADFREAWAALRGALSTTVVGHDEAVDQVLTAFFAGGHVLLEGVPGLGKTLLVRTLAASLGLAYSRIQCTPDLMPADITGTSIVVEEGGRRTFAFRKGPVFTNVLLADEVNRATPKTQSALLEAMEEKAVTAGGETHAIEPPFHVLATQNPLEMEGTFPLPEAQLDRFLFKVLVESPSGEELLEIVDRTTGAPGAAPGRVIDRALVAGRVHASTADVLSVARPALRHRLLLNFEGEAEGASLESILDELLAAVK